MKKGFTLIEILVVIFIVGILAGAGYPLYRRSIERTKQAEGVNTLRAVHSALMRYYTRTGEVLWIGNLNELNQKLDIELAGMYNFDIASGDCRACEGEPIAVVRRHAGGPYGQYRIGIWLDGTIAYYKPEQDPGPGGLP